MEPPAFLPVLLLKKLNDKEPVRNAPDGFFASVVNAKSAYSITSRRLILNLPCAVTLCRPFLSKRKLWPAVSS